MRVLRTLALVPLACACLKFESQSIGLVYDAAADRITLHLLYFGLDRDGAKEEDLEVLDNAVRHGDFCLLDWPFWVSFARLRERAADPKTDPLRRELLQFLVDHARGEFLGFFLDAEGRLSGAQVVRIEKASTLVAIFDRLFEAEVLPERCAGVDPETRRLLDAAASGGHAWLRLRGNAIEFRLPCSESDATILKRKLLDDAVRNPRTSLLVLEALARSSFAFAREGGELVFRLGDPCGPARFVWPLNADVEYDGDLVAIVKERYGLGFDARVRPALLGAPGAPEAMRAFAASLPRVERVRLLLADPSSEATRALEAEGKSREAWEAWLGKEVEEERAWRERARGRAKPEEGGGEPE